MCLLKNSFLALTITLYRVSSAAQSNAPSPNPVIDDDDEEEAFVYPGTTDEDDKESVAEEGFIYQPESPASSIHEPQVSPSPPPGVSQEQEVVEPPAQEARPSKIHPSPAQLEALQAAASSGDLALLKKLFTTALQNGEVESFALANDASPRTGLTAMHAAASRGYLDIVKWRM